MRRPLSTATQVGAVVEEPTDAADDPQGGGVQGKHDEGELSASMGH